MRRIAKLLSFVPVALAFAACDSADQMTTPEYRSQTAQTQPVATTSSTSTSTESQIARLDDGMSDVKGLSSAGIGVDYLGAEGGTIVVWGAAGQIAQLVVPAGAVSSPALFTVLVSGTGSVKLTATRYKNNDVGSAGFAKQVRIYFNPVTHARGRSSGLHATSTTGFEAVGTPVAKGGTTTPNNDPLNPPPGLGWVWVDLDDFSGWIIID